MEIHIHSCKFEDLNHKIPMGHFPFYSFYSTFKTYTVNVQMVHNSIHLVL